MSGTCTPCGPVCFDYSLWQISYPEFNGSVSPGEAQMYFDTATLYLDSGPYSLVRNPRKRLTLLNMLVAHLAKLFQPMHGQPAPDLVGRVSTASEGSVSVSAVMPDDPNGAWFLQTKYGAAFWTATAVYRTFRYTSGPQPYLGVGPYGGYYGRGYYGRGW